MPPEITDFRIAGGDRQAVIAGSRLEQLRWVKVNGKKMIVPGNNQVNQTSNQNISQPSNGYSNQLPAPTSSQPSNLPTPNLPLPKASISSQSPVVSSQMSNPASPINISAPDSGNSSSVNPNERTLVFEDQSARQEGGSVSLELGLDDNRNFAYPVQFKVNASRPAIVAGSNNEIEGTIVGHNTGTVTGNIINGNVQSVTGGNAESRDAIPKRRQIRNYQFSSLGLKDAFPISTKEISVELQNARTDYDFKPENLAIDTRIENGGANTGEMPRISFEVFDWKSMRLNLTLNDQITKIIGGRRLQFRLRDRERGDSDWYTIKQTFVRFPDIKSVTCTNQMNGQCELKGVNIEYLGQISVDGGKNWYPNENGSLQVRQTNNGQSAAMIPFLAGKKLLAIKFRDYPKMDGINVPDFIFSNSVKITKKAAPPEKSNQSVQPADAALPNRQNQPGKSREISAVPKNH